MELQKDIAWKLKAAVDQHTAGSMLFERNNTFALISNLVQRLYLLAIWRILYVTYHTTGMRKTGEKTVHFILISTSFEW